MMMLSLNSEVLLNDPYFNNVFKNIFKLLELYKYLNCSVLPSENMFFIIKYAEHFLSANISMTHHKNVSQKQNFVRFRLFSLLLDLILNRIGVSDHFCEGPKRRKFKIHLFSNFRIFN